MEQKDLLKYGLIAIGAYLIYQYIQSKGGISALFGGTATAPPLPTQPASTLPSTQVPTGITIQPPTNPLTTEQMVLAAANKDNFTIGTADQWGAYYQGVRGIAAPDPGTYLTPANRFEQLTFQEWWNLASGAGLGAYRPIPTHEVYGWSLPASRWLM
jgi:hypothetical protein